MRPGAELSVGVYTGVGARPATFFLFLLNKIHVEIGKKLQVKDRGFIFTGVVVLNDSIFHILRLNMDLINL